MNQKFCQTNLQIRRKYLPQQSIYLNLSSEDKLRKKSDKMFSKLKKVGFYEKEGSKHMRLANKYNDYVNAIGSKCASKLPKRKHGWYISKDD